MDRVHGAAAILSAAWIRSIAMGAPLTNEPAGWYPDPRIQGQQRYWDGTKWLQEQRSETGYKSSAVAGLLQLFFGWFGLGRFYIGSYGIAITQLVLGLLGFATAWLIVGFVILVPLAIWAFIDAIVLFAGGARDSEGRRLR